MILVLKTKFSQTWKLCHRIYRFFITVLRQFSRCLFPSASWQLGQRF